MEPKLFEMFIAFFKIGCLLLGGGYVIVPLLNSELSDKKNWATKEEIINYYAMGQCIPGIIAVNTTLFIGYKLRGIKGALTAFFGLILPPFFAIIILANILIQIANNAIMSYVFWGINISIIILLFLTVKEVWENSIVDKFTFLIFISMLLLSILKVSPSIIILASGICGIIYKKIRKENAI